MLSQIEQSPLYNAINFTYVYSPYGVGDVAAGPVNTTAAGTSVNAFACPSDRMGVMGATGYGAGQTGVVVPDSNYVASSGTKIAHGEYMGKCGPLHCQ